MIKIKTINNVKNKHLVCDICGRQYTFFGEIVNNVFLERKESRKNGWTGNNDKDICCTCYLKPKPSLIFYTVQKFVGHGGGEYGGFKKALWILCSSDDGIVIPFEREELKWDVEIGDIFMVQEKSYYSRKTYFSSKKLSPIKKRIIKEKIIPQLMTKAEIKKRKKQLLEKKR